MSTQKQDSTQGSDPKEDLMVSLSTVPLFFSRSSASISSHLDGISHGEDFASKYDSLVLFHRSLFDVLQFVSVLIEQCGRFSSTDTFLRSRSDGI